MVGWGFNGWLAWCFCANQLETLDQFVFLCNYTFEGVQENVMDMHDSWASSAYGRNITGLWIKLGNQ